MNQTTSKPASSAEISDALRVLFDAGLPFQRGANVEGIAMAYVEALRGMTLEAIHAGIRKFLRGECEDVSLRFVPTAPELAKIVRAAVMPSWVPAERRITPCRHADAGERARMRLKMPMYRHATEINGLEVLDRAHREGLSAMIALATRWGIEVPVELLDNLDHGGEAEWHAARRRAWAEVERNPPPFLLRQTRPHTVVAA